jgi:hypothetical protein
MPSSVRNFHILIKDNKFTSGFANPSIALKNIRNSLATLLATVLRNPANDIASTHDASRGIMTLHVPGGGIKYLNPTERQRFAAAVAPFAGLN